MNIRSVHLLPAILFGFAALPNLSADDAKTGAYAKTPPPLELTDGSRMVFLGDSITHQCLYTQFIEDYFYTRYPKRRIAFRNAGISGDRIEQALARFEADVAAFKPDVVTVLLGMNDGSYQPFDDEIFKKYESGINALFQKIGDTGARGIAFGPTPFDTRQSRINPPKWVAPTPERMVALQTYYNAVLAHYGAWLSDRAAELGMHHVDLAGPMTRLTSAARIEDPTYSMIPDAVHPDPNGHAVIAFSILEQLGVSKMVSAIRATRNPTSGHWSVNAQGGEVTEVEVTESGFRFSFLAESLPWVLPEQARQGYAMTKAGHKLSNERISVSGLSPGRYELLIDGNIVGTYPHQRLAAKVELQENEETPQYQRALAVALANLKRNEIGVRPMRNLWPRHRSGKMSAEEFAKAISDIDRVIALYDEKIYEIRQPRKHVYEIRRSGAGGGGS